MVAILDNPSTAFVPTFAHKEPHRLHRTYGTPNTDCGKAQPLGDGRNIDFRVFSKGQKNLSGVLAEVCSIDSHQNVEIACFIFTSLLFTFTSLANTFTYGAFHLHFLISIVTYRHFLPHFRVIGLEFDHHLGTVGLVALRG